MIVEQKRSLDLRRFAMYNVTVHLYTEIFTIPCQTKHDQLMVIAEWQRLGLDAEVTIA